MSRIERILEMFDKASRDTNERALYHALKCWEPILPEAEDALWFHKAFRQTDVTGNAHQDVMIWCLLDHAPIFWRCFEACQDEKDTAAPAPGQEGGE